MFKYLIIQLDYSSVSFCHYPNNRTESNLMPLEILKEGIFWSMKENLTLQILYPNYQIPKEYKAEIAKTYHADIVASTCQDSGLREKADVVVFDSWTDAKNYQYNKKQAFIFRTDLQSLIDNTQEFYSILPKVDRINVAFTDILSLKEEDEKKYADFLDSLSYKITEEYMVGHAIQINLLTDRILLDNMNNCNAGNETVTLCPDGSFYICPAFYFDKEINFTIGNLSEGLKIKNPQLYKVSHAPICRICDAYQCRRCIWLNRKSTLEVNTPSHEQCVLSHIERNASRKLLSQIREIGEFLPDKEITKINYLDPFIKLQQQ